jgi:hypothetical protein
MDPMPLAGAFADTKQAALAAERFPLTWLWCSDCGLVNVAPDIPDELLFRTYHYASSDIPALVRHFSDYAAFLGQRFERPRVLEIGCNDGVLLKRLPDDWNLVGVDPSDVAWEKQDSGRYGLINLPFTAELARDLKPFDLILASNSLAHFTDLAGVLEGIALLARGEVWVEVHDLEATLTSGQWDTIYHEHKVEWSADSLRCLMARHGFAPISTERLPLHGGLLRMGFQLRSEQCGTPTQPDFSILRATYQDRRQSPTYRILSRQPAVAYGAAGRATVYFNQLPELPFRYVVDDSPQRAGRFIPGVGYPIVGAEQFDADQPPLMFISAWSYAADIKAAHPQYSGRWLTAW